MDCINCKQDETEAWGSLCALFRFKGLTPNGFWKEKPKMRKCALSYYSSDTSMSYPEICAEYRLSGEYQQQKSNHNVYHCICGQLVRNWRYATNKKNGNILRIGGKICYGHIMEQKLKYTEREVIYRPAVVVVAPTPSVTPTPITSEISSNIGSPVGSPATLMSQEIVPVVQESLLIEQPSVRSLGHALRCIRKRPGATTITKRRTIAVEHAKQKRENVISGRRQAYLQCMSGVQNALSRVNAALDALMQAKQELVVTKRVLPALE